VSPKKTVTKSEFGESILRVDYKRNPERTQLESAFRAGEWGYMPNDKLILLIHAKVLPEHRAELLQALRETLPLTRAEAGVELLYPTTRKDDPNTLVFFEVFSSQDAHDFHMQQEYTKRFFATFEGGLAGEPVITNLSELS
jgi:quinol monooxygenase YgiN